MSAIELVQIVVAVVVVAALMFWLKESWDDSREVAARREAWLGLTPEQRAERTRDAIVNTVGPNLLNTGFTLMPEANVAIPTNPDGSVRTEGA